MRVQKRHLFEDCSALAWRLVNERRGRLTDDLTRCTCGQCRMRLLVLLKDTDWRKLPQATVDVLKDIERRVRDGSAPRGAMRVED